MIEEPKTENQKQIRHNLQVHGLRELAKLRTAIAMDVLPHFPEWELVPTPAAGDGGQNFYLQGPDTPVITFGLHRGTAAKGSYYSWRRIRLYMRTIGGRRESRGVPPGGLNIPNLVKQVYAELGARDAVRVRARVQAAERAATRLALFRELAAMELPMQDPSGGPVRKVEKYTENVVSVHGYLVGASEVPGKCWVSGRILKEGKLVKVEDLCSVFNYLRALEDLCR